MIDRMLIHTKQNKNKKFDDHTELSYQLYLGPLLAFSSGKYNTVSML